MNKGKVSRSRIFTGCAFAFGLFLLAVSVITKGVEKHLETPARLSSPDICPNKVCPEFIWGTISLWTLVVGSLLLIVALSYTAYLAAYKWRLEYQNRKLPFMGIAFWGEYPQPAKIVYLFTSSVVLAFSSLISQQIAVRLSYRDFACATYCAGHEWYLLSLWLEIAVIAAFTVFAAYLVAFLGKRIIVSLCQNQDNH